MSRLPSGSLLAIVVVLGLPQAARAQEVKVKEDKPGLLAQATIRPDSARKLALARVPGSRVEAAEIEMEDGKLVYSFDLKVGNAKGIEEVLIDARSGKVVSVEHEDPAAEAKEAPRIRKPGNPPRR